MPAADDFVVDALVVEIFADARNLLKGLEEALEDAEGELEKWDAVEERIYNGIERIKTAAEEAGVVLTDAFIKQLAPSLAEMARIAPNMEKFGDAMDEIMPKIIEEAKLYEKMDEVLKDVNKHYAEMGKVMPLEEQKKLIDQLKKQIKLGNELDTSQKEIIDNMERVGGEFKEATVEGQGLGGMLGGLKGQLTGLITNFAKGLAVLTLLRKAFQSLKKLISESVVEMAQAVETGFELQAAVRGYQMAVGEAAGTQAEWLAFTKDLRAEFGSTTEEVNRMTSAAVTIAAQYHLTGEEAQDLARHSMALAEVTRIGPLSAMQALTQYITRGTIPRIQGLNINLTQSALQAFAFSKGIEQNVKDLSDADQQALRYAFALEQTNWALETASEGADTYTERLERLQMEQEDVKEGIGALAAPFVEFWELMKTRTIQAVGVILATVLKLSVGLGKIVAQGIMAFAVTIKAVIDDLVARYEGAKAAFEKGGIGELAKYLIEGGEDTGLKEKGLLQTFTESWESAGEQFDQIIGEKFSSAFANLADMFGASEDDAAAWSAAMKDMLLEVGEDITKLANQWATGLERIEQRLQDAIADIHLNFARRRRDAAIDLEQDLEKIDLDFMRRRQEAKFENQLEERRRLEDHLIAMKRLEMDYLFDLEDAVRERDARAVIDLTRRYKKEKKEREGDYSLQKQRREQDNKLDLQEMKQLAILKKLERIKAFEEEMYDLAVQEQERIADRQVRVEREIRDLQKNIQNKLQLEAQGLSESLQLNQEYTKQLFDILNAAFGAGGFTEELIERYISLLQMAASATGGTATTAPTVTTTRRQSGGDFIATSPMTMMVGEGRPERVSVTPLSGATGAPMGGFGQEGQPIQIDLNVDADERLIVEVAEQTMSRVADVIVSVNRKSKRGM